MAGLGQRINVKCVKADLVNEADSVVHDRLDVAILLHGIMSSGAEANFELVSGQR